MRSRLIATAGAALAVFASQIAVAAQPPGQPNVVLVITDDQGYGDLSCHGNPVLKTPNLDKLHAESTRLTGYHVAPTCAPTRSALMSGHYTNRTGCWHTIMGRSLMRADETTLGQVFHDAGYQTGMFGKWHLGDNYPFRPEDRGFTEVVRHGGGGVGQTPDYWDNAYFDDTYFHNGKPEKYEGYCTDVYFREARRFVERSAAEGKPFFAYIATNAPHGPFLCPERYWKPYAGMKGVRQAEAVFFGMIANVDENVGALRQWLDDKGLAENTIFIFTTDNGTATGERIFNDGMRGNKGSPYDGGHRVPFFVHWPAKGWTEGRDVDSLCMAYDILPTFIELCGLKAPDGYRFDGVSLAPLLLGQEKSLPDRVCFTDSQRVRDPIKWRQSATMTGRWRLINGEELYDIQTDPGQKNDIADDHPDVVARLRKAYEAWWADLEPSFREDVRIVVGNPAENPSRLTSHDWLT
ncbi:MAG: arylsulfatase, partial [Planctomycetota bacterium]